MTRDELEAIRKRDEAAVGFLVASSLKDRRTLLAWADELASECEAFRIKTAEQRERIRRLLAVVAAADAWDEAMTRLGGRLATPQREAYRAARKTLEDGT